MKTNTIGRNLTETCEQDLCDTISRNATRSQIEAWNAPKGFEVPIVNLITALATYADQVNLDGWSKVGKDGVLGAEFIRIASGIRGLLNGDIGRLDGGTCDRALTEILRNAGFTHAEIDMREKV